MSDGWVGHLLVLLFLNEGSCCLKWQQPPFVTCNNFLPRFLGISKTGVAREGKDRSVLHGLNSRTVLLTKPLPEGHF